MSSKKPSRRNSTLGDPGNPAIGPFRRDTDINEDNLHTFEKPMSPPKPYTPKNWKRPNDSLKGYTGFHESVPDKHELEKPLKKYVIRGYQGFIPMQRQVCGSASVPTLAEQHERERIMKQRKQRLDPNYREPEPEDETPIPETSRSGRGYMESLRNMDLAERYEHAVDKIVARGQTQEMLLRMVKAKISERVKSYSEQRVSLRKLFEAFDFNGDGVLDEMEFRECLERCNIQFDDTQVLALFAYFDGNYQGCIHWESFAEHASVMNPRGGTAVLPKQITATFKTCDWDNIGFSTVGR